MAPGSICYRFSCSGAGASQNQQDQKQAIVDLTARAAAQAMVSGSESAASAAVLGLGALILMDVIDAQQQKDEAAARARRAQEQAQAQARAAEEARAEAEALNATKRKILLALNDTSLGPNSPSSPYTAVLNPDTSQSGAPDAPASHGRYGGFDLSPAPTTTTDQVADQGQLSELASTYPAAVPVKSPGCTNFFGTGNCNVQCTGWDCESRRTPTGDSIQTIVQKVKLGEGQNVCVNFDSSATGLTCATIKPVPIVGPPVEVSKPKPRYTRQQWDDLNRKYQQDLAAQREIDRAAAAAKAEAEKMQAELAAARNAEEQAKAQKALEDAKLAAADAQKKADEAKLKIQKTETTIRDGADIYDENPAAASGAGTGSNNAGTQPNSNGKL